MTDNLQKADHRHVYEDGVCLVQVRKPGPTIESAYPGRPYKSTTTGRCGHKRKDGNPAKAIEALGAVEVAPGRYAFESKATPGRWYTCNESNLKLNGTPSVWTDVNEARLRTCVLMPSWWSPDRRFAIRRGELPDVTLCTMAHPDDANSPSPAYKVTASLSTGEEVPC